MYRIAHIKHVEDRHIAVVLFMVDQHSVDGGRACGGMAVYQVVARSDGFYRFFGRAGMDGKIFSPVHCGNH
jgi:hypothetical protein